MTDYSRLKDILEVPPKTILSDRCIDSTVLGRKYGESNPNLDGFYKTLKLLNNKQRVVVALTALERCEPLAPIKIPYILNGQFGEKVWDVSSNIEGWLKSGFVPTDEDASVNALRNLVEFAARTRNFAPAVSDVAELHNSRALNVRRCAFETVSSFYESDLCYRAIYWCANAVQDDNILKGVSEDQALSRRSGTINEVINRAMCRLAFHDVYEAVLQ